MPHLEPGDRVGPDDEPEPGGLAILLHRKRVILERDQGAGEPAAQARGLESHAGSRLEPGGLHTPGRLRHGEDAEAACDWGERAHGGALGTTRAVRTSR